MLFFEVEVTCSDCGSRQEYQVSSGSEAEQCRVCSSQCIEPLKRKRIAQCSVGERRIYDLRRHWVRHIRITNIIITVSFLLVIVLLVCGSGFWLSLLGLLPMPIYYIVAGQFPVFRLAFILFSEAKHPMNAGSRNYYDALSKIRGYWNGLRQEFPEITDNELCAVIIGRWAKDRFRNWIYSEPAHLAPFSGLRTSLAYASNIRGCL